MLPLLAHGLFQHGRLLAAQGRRDQAGDALCRASAVYRELGMLPWLREVEATLARAYGAR